ALFNAVGAPQSPTGTVSNAPPNVIKQYSWSIRMDETLNGGKDIFSERYGTNPVTQATPALTFFPGLTLPNFGAIGTGVNHFVNVSYSHVFSPAVVNQARFQFARLGDFFEPNTTMTPPFVPAISISGFSLMGLYTQVPQSRVQNIFQFSD